MLCSTDALGLTLRVCEVCSSRDFLLIDDLHVASHQSHGPSLFLCQFSLITEVFGIIDGTHRFALLVFFLHEFHSDLVR